MIQARLLIPLSLILLYLYVGILQSMIGASIQLLLSEAAKTNKCKESEIENSLNTINDILSTTVFNLDDIHFKDKTNIFDAEGIQIQIHCIKKLHTDFDNSKNILHIQVAGVNGIITIRKFTYQGQIVSTIPVRETGTATGVISESSAKVDLLFSSSSESLGFPIKVESNQCSIDLIRNTKLELKLENSFDGFIIQSLSGFILDRIADDIHKLICISISDAMSQAVSPTLQSFFSDSVKPFINTDFSTSKPQLSISSQQDYIQFPELSIIPQIESLVNSHGASVLNQIIASISKPNPNDPNDKVLEISFPSNNIIFQSPQNPVLNFNIALTRISFGGLSTFKNLYLKGSDISNPNSLLLDVDLETFRVDVGIVIQTSPGTNSNIVSLTLKPEIHFTLHDLAFHLKVFVPLLWKGIDSISLISILSFLDHPECFAHHIMDNIIYPMIHFVSLKVGPLTDKTFQINGLDGDLDDFLSHLVQVIALMVKSDMSGVIAAAAIFLYIPEVNNIIKHSIDDLHRSAASLKVCNIISQESGDDQSFIDWSAYDSNLSLLSNTIDKFSSQAYEYLQNNPNLVIPVKMDKLVINSDVSLQIHEIQLQGLNGLQTTIYCPLDINIPYSLCPGFSFTPELKVIVNAFVYEKGEMNNIRLSVAIRNLKFDSVIKLGILENIFFSSGGVLRLPLMLNLAEDCFVTKFLKGFSFESLKLGYYDLNIDLDCIDSCPSNSISGVLGTFNQQSFKMIVNLKIDEFASEVLVPFANFVTPFFVTNIVRYYVEHLASSNCKNQSIRPCCSAHYSHDAFDDSYWNSKKLKEKHKNDKRITNYQVLFGTIISGFLGLMVALIIFGAILAPKKDDFSKRMNTSRTTLTLPLVNEEYNELLRAEDSFLNSSSSAPISSLSMSQFKTASNNGEILASSTATNQSCDEKERDPELDDASGASLLDNASTNDSLVNT